LAEVLLEVVLVGRLRCQAERDVVDMLQHGHHRLQENLVLGPGDGRLLRVAQRLVRVHFGYFGGQLIHALVYVRVCQQQKERISSNLFLVIDYYESFSQICVIDSGQLEI